MSSEPVVVRNTPENRFEIIVDGAPAGRLLFADRDGQRVLQHTEIDDSFGGRGLAGHLVAESLDASRRDGWRVVPVCEYVQSWLGKHPGFEDIVDPVSPETEREI